MQKFGRIGKKNLHIRKKSCNFAAQNESFAVFARAEGICS
jgi:hypothetical protein